MSEIEPQTPAAAPALQVELTETPATHTTNSEFTPTQLQQMAKWEIEAGRLTVDKANELLAADGVKPLATRPPPSAELKEFETAFPTAKPEEYKIPHLTDKSEAYGPEPQKFDSEIRGWLSSAGFARENGSSVAEQVVETSRKFHAMKDPERTAYTDGQSEILKRVWGESYSEKMGVAQKFVQELEQKSPGLVDMLERTGAGSNAMVISQLVMQAEGLKRKKGAK